MARQRTYHREDYVKVITVVLGLFIGMGIATHFWDNPIGAGLGGATGAFVCLSLANMYYKRPAFQSI
jgi:hypothetical protein